MRTILSESYPVISHEEPTGSMDDCSPTETASATHMKTRAYSAFLSLLIIFSACRSTRPALEPVPVEIAGMDNAAVVGDLMIGGQPDEQSLGALAAAGYRSIVTVRGDGEIDWDEEGAVEALGMSFERIDMSNPVNEITDAQVEAFARFMEERDGPALVHCGSGNRAAGLWAVWLIEYEGIEFEEAVRFAKAAGMRESIQAVVERRIRD